MGLSLVKMPSDPNALEISDIQEHEIVATPRRRSECNNVTLRRKQPNGIFAYHNATCMASELLRLEINPADLGTH